MSVKQHKEENKRISEKYRIEEEFVPYVEEHIPYRLTLVDTFSAMSLLGMTMLVGGNRVGYQSREFRIHTVDGTRTGDVSLLQNLAIESGLINCRFLLNAFCLRYDADMLGEHKPKRDDVIVNYLVPSDSTVSAPELAEALNKTPDFTFANGLEIVSLSKVLSRMLYHADKSAAHLKVEQKPSIGLDWYCGTVATTLLVEQFVYERCNRVVPFTYHATHRLLDTALFQLHQQTRQELKDHLRSYVFEKIDSSS